LARGTAGTTELTVRTEPAGWLSSGSAQLVRLTQGLLNYFNPMPSRDGRRIFADGWRAPYLGGIDAEGVSFSLDGHWAG
jgi:hypothetical protein